MEDILIDLAIAICDINRFYYSVPKVDCENETICVNNEDIRVYERRFVAEMKSKFDMNIANNQAISNCYVQKYTDFELPKTVIGDERLSSIYNSITGKAIVNIETIPDFIIHKSQNNYDEENQILVVEVKTNPQTSPKDLYLDWFKSCIYVEKFNYQVSVSLVVNQPVEKVEEKAKEYIETYKYLPEKCIERVWLFIKPSYDANLTMVKLSELR